MKKLFLHIILVSTVILTYNWANDISESIFPEESGCYISEKIDAPQMSANRSVRYLPEAELGSIGTNLYQTGDSRNLRINFNTHLLKLSDRVRSMSQRQTLLVRQWEKSSDSSILSISHPVSEYYVFALRHIII